MNLVRPEFIMDLLYLRIDFGNNQNIGYAFVNFVHPEFFIKRVGSPWRIFSLNKRCEVSYAAIQGIDCLLAKFRNSVIMEEYSAFRPKLWILKQQERTQLNLRYVP